ncbi:MAG: ABC transporter ATP-binding protein [bacterium]
MKEIGGMLVVKFFTKCTLRYKWWVLLSILASSGAVVLESIVPRYLKKIFDALEEKASLEAVVAILVSLLGINLASWAAWRVWGYVAAYSQPKLMRDIMVDGLNYVLGHSYDFFANNFAGSIMRKIGRAGNAWVGIMDELQLRITPMVIILSVTLISFYARFKPLALIFLIFIVVFLALSSTLSVWKYRMDLKRAKADSEAGGVISDALTNSVTIKIFAAREAETKNYFSVAERWRKLLTKSWFRGETSTAINTLLMALVEFGLMYYAILLWSQGIMTIGDLALIQGFLALVIGRLWEFGRSIRTIMLNISDAKEFVELMTLPYEVNDAPKAKTLKVTKARIEFKNVIFGFKDGREVLERLSFVAEPKEKIALVGPSGAGKSTIVKLLMRFYDLKSGTIAIDGQDIAKVTQNSLRSRIALVPQEPVLFHRTLMENNRYGKPGASDKEVMAAAKKAHIHKFILSLEKGYETYVGERGVKLSGGERQRVAIARAILKDAPILVLDEATSSLDSESEQLIQAALSELMKNKTTIVIAHRLSTIMKMDRILVIEGGAVADSGRHLELLDAGGTYEKLWKIQAGGFAR